mgnify:CR=1 FL=1
MKVYKFGGASVKNAAGVRNLAQIVAREKGELVVVVSAMGKTTNALERLVSLSLTGEEELMMRQLGDIRDYHFGIVSELFPAGHTFIENKLEAMLGQILACCKAALVEKPEYDEFYDSVVSFGELMSTRIVSYVLDREGTQNICLDMTKLLVTDDTYREARPDMKKSQHSLKSFMESNPARVYVAQGFIGGTESGRRTTLGREGSDYSAALIANMLDAESVTIWKDVPGILNADPRLISETTLIHELTYFDAVELAYSGAQVIHPKTIRPLENKHIPLYVKPFMNPEAEGSVIKDTTAKPIDVPVFIWRKNQVLVTLRAKDFSFVLEDSLNRLFETIYRHRLKVSMIQSSAITVSVCVDKSRYLEAALKELSEDYRVTFNEGLSLLTIRGTTPEIIAQHTEGKTILLSQTTRRTARYVIKE